jgi:hypothetical protein
MRRPRRQAPSAWQFDLFAAVRCSLQEHGCTRRMVLEPTERLPPSYCGWRARYGGFCAYHGVLHPAHPGYDYSMNNRPISARRRARSRKS